MSFDTVSAEIDRILLECDISKDELANMSIVVPAPAKAVGKKGVKTKQGLTIKKYVVFEPKATKEDKMLFVLNHLVRSTSTEFLVEMKAQEWLDISYSRAYKDCTGGPVFLVGTPIAEYNMRSDRRGRTRYGEINGRFPIHALAVACANKYHAWRKLKEHGKELSELKSQLGPSDDELEDIDLTDL